MEINHFKTSKMFLEAVMEGISSPIFILDSNLRIISLNHSFRDLFYDGERELVGRLPGNAICCANLKHGEECGSTAHCTDCVLREAITEAVKYDALFKKKYLIKEFRINGIPVKKVIRFSAKPLKYQEQRLYLCVFDDVTEEYSLEEKAAAQDERIRLDLLMARGIQAELLPKTDQIGNLVFSYFSRPCETLGGDFLCYYPIEKRHTAIIIADVSGHGLVSSMFTVFLFSIIDRTLKSPKKILESLFRKFSEFNVEPEIYITLMCGVYDSSHRTLTFANAGFQNMPVILSDSGIRTVETDGFPISNWTHQTDYREETVEFAREDRLILFSDGLTDLRNTTGMHISLEEIYTLFHNLKKTGKQAISDALHEIRIRYPSMIRDDITVLVVDHSSGKKR